MIMTWNLDQWLNLTRETWQCQKKVIMVPRLQIMMPFSFFQFLSNLEQSRSWIPGACSVVVWWRDWGYTSHLGPPSNSGLADPHSPPNLFQSLNTTILLIPWNSPNDEMGEEYIWVWSTIQTNRKQNANNRKDFKQ